MRWAIALQQFDHTVKYTRERENIVVDDLSRPLLLRPMYVV